MKSNDPDSVKNGDISFFDMMNTEKVNINRNNNLNLT